MSFHKSVSIKHFNLQQTYCSGVFGMGATGAMAPVILRKRLIAPAVSNRNGKILLTLGTRNIKILNTLLLCHKNGPPHDFYIITLLHIQQSKTNLLTQNQRELTQKSE